MSAFDEVLTSSLSVFDLSSYLKTPKVFENPRKPKIHSPFHVPERTAQGNSPLPPKLSSLPGELTDSARSRAQTFYNSDFTEQMDQVSSFFTNIYQNLQDIVQTRNDYIESAHSCIKSTDSIDELMDITINYDPVQYLGRGAYGKVYEAIDRLLQI